MRERDRVQAGTDGVCWWCTSCKTTLSIRVNSFFTQAVVSPHGLVGSKYPAAVEAEMTELYSMPSY